MKLVNETNAEPLADYVIVMGSGKNTAFANNMEKMYKEKGSVYVYTDIFCVDDDVPADGAMVILPDESTLIYCPAVKD